MKKLSFFADAIQTSLFSLVLLMSACMVGFTSCSDDDDEKGGETGIVGTWHSVSVTMWETIGGEFTEDGKHEGPYTGSTIKFTADGRVLTTDEDGTISGTYKFTGDKLIVNSDGETTEAKVLRLTGEELVFEYTETDGDYQYYMKAVFARGK